MVPKHAEASDYLSLAILSLLWGSGFMFIEFALESFGPLSLAASRIMISAVFLFLLSAWRGLYLPTDWKIWKIFLIAGGFGSFIPFTLISWAQMRIDSSMAAIVMGMTPISTMLLAHYMTHDEKLTPKKIGGVIVGFAGVLTLFGGFKIDFSSAAFLGQLAILGAGLGYAFASLKMRDLSHLEPMIVSTGFMVCSGIFAIPLAFIFDPPFSQEISTKSLIAIIYLGTLPSALAAILMVRLIFRAGATFLSLNNYFVPLVGIAWGATLMDEKIGTATAAGFLLIMVGVALTSRFRRSSNNNKGH